MNHDKLKQMYADGGLLKALLKDPAQRAMAAKMLDSNTDSVVDGNAGRGGTMKYNVGGKMMYADGGDVDPDPLLDLLGPKAKQRRYSRALVPSVEEAQFKEELSNYADEYLRNTTLNRRTGVPPIQERKRVVEAVMSGDYSYPMARDAYRYAMDQARERGILEERFVDRETEEYVTPDMMEDISSRGMRFMPVEQGSYTYMVGR
jgi:hypothetical protein